jgi:putative hemolysin
MDMRSDIVRHGLQLPDVSSRSPVEGGSQAMTSMGDIEVRLARTPAEVAAAQRLRYQVFYGERGARPDSRMRRSQRDVDLYDSLMDHLVVIDHGRSAVQGRVVGNYRLLRQESLGPHGHFYSSGEFDIQPLLSSGQRLLELGRSCVLREYRSLPVLQLLWRGIAAYVAEHRIELMFGCASLHGTDAGAWREQLAYLHHYYLAPAELRPRALPSTRIDIALPDKACVDPARAMAGLEPIIKGYLRLGAGVGEGVCLDQQFNAIDVCIVMPTSRLKQKYLRHYQRGQPLLVRAPESEPALAVEARLAVAG